MTVSVLLVLVPFPEEELPARYLDAVRMLRGNLFFFFNVLKKIVLILYWYIVDYARLPWWIR